MTTRGGDYILALDIGERRIGVAIAHTLAAIPTPLTTLENNDDFLPKLLEIIEKEQVGTIVAGLPRGMNGQDTAQTAYTKTFVDKLQNVLDRPIHLQDEAVTSVGAERELLAGGKGYNKGMVDAQAAAIILEDYLREKKHIA